MNALYCSLLQNATLATEQTAFLHVFLTIIGVIVFVVAGLRVSTWLRPNKPYAEKLTTYESGVEPIGNAWAPVNSRLYMIGLVFILFELETILLFPWATIWIVDRPQQMDASVEWNLYMAISGTFFILVLAVGLVYAIVKGRLTSLYSMAASNQLEVNGKVPLAYYEKINQQYASHNSTIHQQVN